MFHLSIFLGFLFVVQSYLLCLWQKKRETNLKNHFARKTKTRFHINKKEKLLNKKILQGFLYLWPETFYVNSFGLSSRTRFHIIRYYNMLSNSTYFSPAHNKIAGKNSTTANKVSYNTTKGFTKA